MEIRVLKYFLAVANEQNISSAAEVLYMSQPTLSRQLRELEIELGKQLFIRGNRKITLTKEGHILRKRAEEIIALANKTENEIKYTDNTVKGNIYIGAGETYAVRFIAMAANSLKEENCDIKYHITSGDAVDIEEKLDKGLFDFAIMLNHVDLTKYSYIELPHRESWGVIMQYDDPLAKKEYITPTDLYDKPLIFSRQALKQETLFSWFGLEKSGINIIATYNLLYNAAIMTKYGLGYSICIDKIINATRENGLCYRPLMPAIETSTALVWKKNQVFSKACEKFIEHIGKTIKAEASI